MSFILLFLNTSSKVESVLISSMFSYFQNTINVSQILLIFKFSRKESILEVRLIAKIDKKINKSMKNRSGN